MCNLYSETKGQAAIRALFRTAHDRTGNLPAFPGIFPDQLAPIVRNSADGERELQVPHIARAREERVEELRRHLRADIEKVRGVPCGLISCPINEKGPMPCFQELSLGFPFAQLLSQPC